MQILILKTLNWYDSETGGNLIYTGSIYNPNLTETTTYWYHH